MNKTATYTVILMLLGIGQTSLFGQAVKETSATIALATGANPQGVIQGANAQGIIFSSVSGQPGKLVPYSSIRGEGLDKLVRIGARNEFLGNPRALFAAGNYVEAAAEFGKVSDAFAFLIALPKSFAVEARFFQIESLRRAGALAEITPLLQTPAAKAITTGLGKNYQRSHVFHKLWGIYGEKKMDELKAALESYQVPVSGQMKLLSEPNFKEDLPTSELVQLAFLRAKLYAAAGENKKALDDYYRVITLTFGNDSFLAKQSMGAAMVIQKADPKLPGGNDKGTLRRMQSITYLYGKNFGAMPPAFKEYNVRPDVPKQIEAEVEKPKAAPEDAKKAVPKDAKKPAAAPKKPAAAPKKPAEKKKEA